MNLDFQGCCNCDKNQFLCKNKKCVPQEWTCNGIDDCGDRSDELADLCKGCMLLLYHIHNNTYSINSGEYSLFCNKLPSFSDIVCEKGYFTCSNKVCIPTTKLCDGYNDCGDNSDEKEICNGNIY